MDHEPYRITSTATWPPRRAHTHTLCIAPWSSAEDLAGVTQLGKARIVATLCVGLYTATHRFPQRTDPRAHWRRASGKELWNMSIQTRATPIALHGEPH